MGMYAVTCQGASTGTNTHDVKGALPAATEEEKIMRKNSKVEWDEVEEEQRDQEVRLQRQTARAANIRAALHMREAAAKRAKTSRALVGVSMSETLKFELPSQRDNDSTLLHRRMPNFDFFVCVISAGEFIFHFFYTYFFPRWRRIYMEKSLCICNANMVTRW